VHKATTTIVKNHGIVVIEDLKVKPMTKTARDTVEGPRHSLRSPIAVAHLEHQ
jgi:hypothetical protein